MDGSLLELRRKVASDPDDDFARLALDQSMRHAAFVDPLPLLEGDWFEVFKPDYCGSPELAFPGCPVSTDGFTREDVAEVIALSEGENEGPQWLAAVRLKDGRFAHVRAGCDYTGWG